jgi:hypothetical protein
MIRVINWRRMIWGGGTKRGRKRERKGEIWKSYVEKEYNIYKKFWIELIAYFLLIQREPHRN